MRKTLFLCAFIASITACMLPGHSHALMEGMSTERLTRASDTVIMGKVLSVTSYWAAGGDTIMTRAVILNTDEIKGRSVPRRVVVEYEGGEVGDIGLKISDAVTLSRGEQVLLFLKQKPDTFGVVGKAQGKYTIGKDGIARKKGFALIRGRELIDNNLPVEELINRIRQIQLQ